MFVVRLVKYIIVQYIDDSPLNISYRNPMLER